MPNDYSINSALQAMVPPNAYRSERTLRTSLRKCWARFPMSQIRAAVDQWPARLAACTRALGSFFEMK